MSFVKDNNIAGKCIVSGFSGPEEGFTWTDGHRAELMIPVAVSEDDLDLVFHAGGFNRDRGFNGDQKSIFNIDGDKLETITVGKEGEYRIRIPAKYTEDGAINIVIDLPDAESPFNAGISEDKRVLGVRFIDMKLVAHDEEG